MTNHLRQLRLIIITTLPLQFYHYHLFEHEQKKCRRQLMVVTVEISRRKFFAMCSVDNDNARKAIRILLYFFGWPLAVVWCSHTFVRKVPAPYCLSIGQHLFAKLESSHPNSVLLECTARTSRKEKSFLSNIECKWIEGNKIVRLRSSLSGSGNKPFRIYRLYTFLVVKACKTSKSRVVFCICSRWEDRISEKL